MLWLNHDIDHKVARFISRCLGIDFVPRRFFYDELIFHHFQVRLTKNLNIIEIESSRTESSAQLVTKNDDQNFGHSDVDDEKFPTSMKLWGFTIEIGNPAESGM